MAPKRAHSPTQGAVAVYQPLWCFRNSESDSTAVAKSGKGRTGSGLTRDAERPGSAALTRSDFTQVPLRLDNGLFEHDVPRESANVRGHHGDGFVAKSCVHAGHSVIQCLDHGTFAAALRRLVFHARKHLSAKAAASAVFRNPQTGNEQSVELCTAHTARDQRAVVTNETGKWPGIASKRKRAAKTQDAFVDDGDICSIGICSQFPVEH